MQPEMYSLPAKAMSAVMNDSDNTGERSVSYIITSKPINNQVHAAKT